MLYLLIGIIALGVVTAIIGYVGNHKRQKTGANGETAYDGSERDETTSIAASDCCGQHEVCERDNLQATLSKNIEYYDDEELDHYAETEPDAYTDEAIEAFGEVLYTLRENEVAGWLRSLQLRRIHLPTALKDEAILLLNENRMSHHKT